MSVVRSLAFWPLALAAALATPRGGQPAFAPAEGATRSKVFQTEMELSVSDFSVLLAGADPGAPEMVLDGKWTRRLKVTDEYRRTAAGRPEELARTYDAVDYELEYEMTVDEEGTVAPGSGTGTSELMEHQVLFQWNKEAGEYEKFFVGDGSDEGLLENLTEDMDLRAFLPESEVVVGDQWEIAASAFLDTIHPAAGLPIAISLQVPEHDPRFPVVGIDPRIFIDLNNWISVEPEGAVKAKYSGEREVEGRNLAEIVIEAEVESAVDATELWAERIGGAPIEGAQIEPKRITAKLELEGRGVLLWDLEAGLLHSFEFEGSPILTAQQELTVDADETALAIEAKLEFEGSYRMSVHCEP